MAGLPLPLLVIIDEVVVGEAESRGLEVALFPIGVNHCVVVRPVTRTIVEESSRGALFATSVGSPSLPVYHLELRLVLCPPFLLRYLQLVLGNRLLSTHFRRDILLVTRDVAMPHANVLSDLSRI